MHAIKWASGHSYSGLMMKTPEVFVFVFLRVIRYASSCFVQVPHCYPQSTHRDIHYFSTWVQNSCQFSATGVKVCPLKSRKFPTLVVPVSGHLDHGLRGSVQENKLLKESLFQLHLSGLAHHKDVRAQLEDPIHAWQLLEHDGARDAVEEFPHELANHQHHWHVEAHDAM